MALEITRDDALEVLKGCQAVAPSGLEQQAFSIIFQTMEGAGETYATIALHLANAAIDGMKHGNWPTDIWGGGHGRTDG